MPLAASMRIMIADDQQTSRLLIRSALNDIGVKQIEMAKDGQEALDMVLRQPVHLVISDYHMPRLNGVELLRAVRANPPTKRSAFFMLTGVDNAQFLQQAVQLQINNYLKKPVSTPELKKKSDAVFGVLQ